MIFRLIDAVENNTVYGYLEVQDIEEEKVQDKIYEIKNRFYDGGFYDWTINDVLNEFPEEWNWNFYEEGGVLEI